METPERACTAFEGNRRIAGGTLTEVALQAKAVLDAGQWAQVLIFDDVTSELIEVDFRGTPEDVLGRLRERDPVEETARRPGRPKLGVVAREVTLLPRHWAWLASQPGGASVALRKLVEQASRANQGRDRQRRAKDSAYRFLSAMAGNLPGFEEATRALFADRPEQLAGILESWPIDIRDHAKKLVAAAFEGDGPEAPDQL
ncbi:DUF2239 family protein [uncultured Paludibaculum sp.]|uniref:DUF2239 family protein n=1 Tax=uncultured Paludibaculum sp. TaxID=1765020 RepID=UPI002AAB018D|nr:DUF2239 family protein [uncultured Paludibaculum sp.]